MERSVSMARSWSILAHRLVGKIRARRVQALSDAAPASVRRLSCPDGRTLQAIVVAKDPGTPVSLEVDLPGIGVVEPVESHGGVHRFSVPLAEVLTDRDWSEAPLRFVAGRTELAVQKPRSAGLVDGPAFLGEEDWATIKFADSRALLVRHARPVGVALVWGTRTADGLRLALAPDITEVTLECKDGTRTDRIPAESGITEISLEVLPERGADGPHYWKVSAVCGGERLPILAPDADVGDVRRAYGFRMLTVHDPEDGRVYYAKPYFANADRALTIRTGVRAEADQGSDS